MQLAVSPPRAHQVGCPVVVAITRVAIEALDLRRALDFGELAGAARLAKHELLTVDAIHRDVRWRLHRSRTARIAVSAVERSWHVFGMSILEPVVHEVLHRAWRSER